MAARRRGAPSSRAGRRRSCRTRRRAAGRGAARRRAIARETTGASSAPCAGPKSARRVPLASRSAGGQRERLALGAERDEAQRADVDRRAGLEPRAVQPLVLVLEALDERRDRRPRRARPAARSGRSSSGRGSGRRRRAATRARRRCCGASCSRISASSRASASRSGSRALIAAEADVVVLGAREQQPGRGEEARERRHDRRARAELGRERRGVHRARAAVGDEHEVGRVAALLGRDGAERAHRRRVREVVDAARRLERREAELRAERADGRLGQLARHGQRAGGERARARCSRARRSRRSPSARCRRARSRRGPGVAPALRGPTCRPPASSSQAIEPPPAPTSAMSIVGMRISSPEPRSSRLPAESAAPTSYSWLSETRPSWISDALAVVPPRSNAIAFAWPSCRASDERRDDAGGRARLERVDGPRGRVRGGHRAARGLQHRERRRDAGGVEPAAQVGDVAAHQRRDVGVDDGGRGALVLLLLARDLARERDRDARAAPRAGSRRAAARGRGGGARAAGRRRPPRRRRRRAAPRARGPRPRRAA